MSVDINEVDETAAPAPVSPKPVRVVTLSVAAITVISILNRVGQSLTIALWHFPWVLVALSPNGMFLAHSAERDPFWLYLTIGLLRSLLPLVPHYLLGKYGREYLATPRPPSRFAVVRWFKHRLTMTMHWAKARLVAVVRWLRRWTGGLERLFGRVKAKLLKYLPHPTYLLIFVRPDGWMMLLAGGQNLNRWKVAATSVAGTIVWLLLVAFLGQYIPPWVFLITSII